MTLQTTYKKVTTIVNKRIKDGSLPKAYKLPPLASFAVPSDVPNPDYVFTPMGLTFTQWDKLLKKTCNGEWHSDALPDDFNKGSGWELWLVNGDPTPTITNISKNDAVAQKHVLAPLQVLIAQQWLHLEQGQEPVDKNTWSLCEENVKVGGVVRSVFRGFGLSNRQVYSSWNDLDSAYGNSGVRASASGKDLSPQALSNPLSSVSDDTNSDGLDEILGDLFVATHGGKTAHDLPGNLDQHDYAKAKSEINKLRLQDKIDEWVLIHETLHAATLAAQSHINKVMKDRIIELEALKISEAKP